MRMNRRSFLKGAGAGAAGLAAASALPRFHVLAANNQKLRHAAIGVGGFMGGGDLRRLADHPDIEIVALCDVDERYLEEAREGFPDVRVYRDWRVLLEEEEGRIDSINATVPDHSHAPISVSALRKGIHVYCQKPLTRSIHESRVMAREAARSGLVTQMGVQTHNAAYYRTAVAMAQAGVVGRIKEAHSWCIRSERGSFDWTGDYSDPPTERRPDREDEVPDYLDWDLWLGAAPERPYAAASDEGDYWADEGLYQPMEWRRWRDFAGGTHGDMGGHMMDAVFTCLELTAPKWIESHGTPPYEETYSGNNKVLHRFPGTRFTTGDIDYYWYDSGPVNTEGWPIAEEDLAMDGSMLIGERGYLYLPHGSSPEVLPEDDLQDAVEWFEDRIGRQGDVNHYHQFVDACLGRGLTSTPFAYGGRLTETVLMGNIAHEFVGERLEWDAQNLTFPNKPEADAHLRQAYREGWEIDGLG